MTKHSSDPTSSSHSPAARELRVHPIRLVGPESEFSFEFIQMMANRMAVSYHRFGPLTDAYPHRAEALASLQERLDRYRDVGNAEWLIDVANYAMIEFMHPSHEAAHFCATDAAESPGRKLWGGASEPGSGIQQTQP